MNVIFRCVNKLIEKNKYDVSHIPDDFLIADLIANDMNILINCVQEPYDCKRFYEYKPPYPIKIAWWTTMHNELWDRRCACIRKVLVQ